MRDVSARGVVCASTAVAPRRVTRGVVRAGLVALALGTTACAPPAPDERAFNGAVRAWNDLRYLGTSPNQRVDVLVPVDQQSPPSLVVFVHGGGWMMLRKENSQLAFAPFLSAGWAVANVEYRRGFEATAPAAAVDVRCAIKWTARRGEEFGFDATRLVLVGESAGAHLVLLAAFADSTAGLDGACPGPMPRVAGIVNWMGVTDVADLLTGPNTRGWATGWIGALPGGEARARALSPLRWVRAGLPPVLTLHGDRDATVPYTHATRLHAALDSAGVPNELVTLRGADHGAFGPSVGAAAWSDVLRWVAQRHGAGTP